MPEFLHSITKAACPCSATWLWCVLWLPRVRQLMLLLRARNSSSGRCAPCWLPIATNAIVRRVDTNGAEFFVNAGGTKQTGIEALVTAWLMAPKRTGLIRAIQMTGSYTHSHFLFRNYQDATTDYSGNRLTGVPQTVVVLGITLRFAQGVSLSAESNSTARLPLNDGNTEYAGKYNLLQANVRWSTLRIKKVGIEIFAGADNVLNEKYSLGNDINAFGGRYFNAAAPLNFYAGMNFNFH